jgi:hypothetical protein
MATSTFKIYETWAWPSRFYKNVELAKMEAMHG